MHEIDDRTIPVAPREAIEILRDQSVRQAVLRGLELTAGGRSAEATLLRIQEAVGQCSGVFLRRRYKPRFATIAAEHVAAEIEDLADLAVDPPPADSWVEVVVVDDEGRPQAGVGYEIRLSDGRLRTGRTDQQGRLYYDEIPDGTCELSMIEFGDDRWELSA